MLMCLWAYMSVHSLKELFHKSSYRVLNRALSWVHFTGPAVSETTRSGLALLSFDEHAA